MFACYSDELEWCQKNLSVTPKPLDGATISEVAHINIISTVIVLFIDITNIGIVTFLIILFLNFNQ